MITRKEGYLQPEKRHAYPKRMLFVDTETHIINKDNGMIEFPFKLGVAIYVQIDNNCTVKVRCVEHFRRIKDFIRIIERYSISRTPLYIIGHNIGFDVRVMDLPVILGINRWENEPPIINGRAFIWQLNRDKHRLIFIDTANFGAISVNDMGKTLGYPKLEVDFETATDEELAHYCEVDTEITEKFTLGYLKYLMTNNLGGFKLTLAGQALAAYRTVFMQKAPYIHCNLDAIALERNGYYGGRTEAFYIGSMPQQDYFYLDVNSMYPASMLKHKLPRKLLGYTEDVPIEHLRARLGKYYVIADVTLTTEHNDYPYRYNGKLIFPIGTFRTVLHHYELLPALERGEIVQIHRCAVYEPFSTFKPYVDFFYAAKDRYDTEGNQLWRSISKLFLNGLYGKFGQLDTKRILVGQVEDKGIWRQTCVNIDTGEVYNEYTWYGNVYREYRSGETAFSYPAIAGAITSGARAILRDYRNIAGHKHVFYTDTDSLITDEAGYRQLSSFIDKHTIGYLKLEKQSSNFHINGAKDYAFGDSIKIKGIPPKAQQLSANSWEFMQFQGFITWLNQGAQGPPTAIKVIKHRKSLYNKGIVEANGSVTPFKLPFPTE